MTKNDKAVETKAEATVETEPGAPDEPIVMETITDQYVFNSLAGGGQNTIRKLSEKYETIGPGDVVLMEYRKAVGEPALAVEKLVVASVAVAPLEVIVVEHGGNNHGVARGPELEALIVDRYGNDDPEAPYLAIYFM